MNVISEPNTLQHVCYISQCYDYPHYFQKQHCHYLLLAKAVLDTFEYLLHSLYNMVSHQNGNPSTDSIIFHNSCLCKTLQSSSVSLNLSSIFSTCMFTSNICIRNVYKKQLQWGWVKSHYVEMRHYKWCNLPYTKDFRNHIFAIMGCAYARRAVYKDSNASDLNFPTRDKLF
jgi:hypothetical protein